MLLAMVGTNMAKTTKWIFSIAFLLACLLFWWLPSVLFRIFQITDPVTDWTLWASALGVGSFFAGYLLPPLHFRTGISASIIDLCEGFAWRATQWIALPALLVAVRFSWYRAGIAYGQGEGLSLADQAILYTHMFFAFLFLGATKTTPVSRRRIIAAAVLVTLPRLIVSLHWGRFFFAQSVVPILFIVLARGWIRLTLMRCLQLAAMALIIVFVPALTRGEQFLQQLDLIRFFAAGSSLTLLENNTHLDLTDRCPPLLVSMTAKLIPYSLMGVCTIDIWGRKGLPATIDRILAFNDPALEGTMEGPGGNYLLELYLSGGLAMIAIGSAFFGFTNRCFIAWISRRSIFAGIWAECLSRSLFAPRSTLGYVYERIPSLALATGLVVVIAIAARILVLNTTTGGEEAGDGLST
jgi:hypothetical protein